MGVHEEHSHDWTIVIGKWDGDWRGEGIAYITAQFGHDAPAIHQGALSLTLKHTGGGRTGVMAAHMPHHATVPQAREILTV